MRRILIATAASLALMTGAAVAQTTSPTVGNPSSSTSSMSNTAAPDGTKTGTTKSDTMKSDATKSDSMTSGSAATSGGLGGQLASADELIGKNVYGRDNNKIGEIEDVILDANGKAVHPAMGCYGVGVSRIVAAAIEQNHDDAGIIWPDAMAPWSVAVCVINPKNDPAVAAAAAALHDELQQRGIDVVLDDRGLRPGAMFADMELIGVPHRVVVSERGLAAGQFEYRHRRAGEAEALDREALLARLGA